MPVIYDKFVFKTDLLFEDYMELNKIIIGKMMLLLVIAIDAFFCYMIFDRIGRSIPVIVLIFAALFVVLYLLEWYFIRWRAKKIFGKTTVSREIKITMDDEVIVQESRTGETTLAWKDVYRVVGGKRCYFIFLTKNKAFYFPKRNFKDKDDEQLFCDYIIRNTTPFKVKF
ncbi:MAG: YcxB family protein [Clostridia bacterium]|nr:YcxB family protein [Clostridia bacterium]